MLGNLLRSAVLPLYRLLALASLYLVLFGVLGYSFLVGFYAVNKSWIAPVILSPSDDKTLDLTSRLVLSESTLENLKLDVGRLQDGVAEMESHKAALALLRPEIDLAIEREMEHDESTGKELASLNLQKRQDNEKTQHILEQIAEVEAQLDRDLAAGLITKGDAAVVKTQLNQQRNGLTDGKIGEVLLQDNVLQKTTVGTPRLDVLAKRTELESQITQLDIQIATSQKQITTEEEQIARLEEAIAAAKQTPYYLSSSTGKPLHFAFVPYDNKEDAKPDAPVYDCYLSFVGCRYVGTVKRVFHNEEAATNPVFRTQMRGFFIELDLEHPEAATSKTLMLGRKPFLI